MMKDLFKKSGAAFFLAISLGMINCNLTSPGNGPSPQKIIKDYYAAYEKKDWNLMELLLADGFSFTSPNDDDHKDIKKFKEKCWPGAYKIKKFDIDKIIDNGDEAFARYTCQTTDDKFFRNTEYFKFKDGKIKEIEVFFGAGINFPN